MSFRVECFQWTLGAFEDDGDGNENYDDLELGTPNLQVLLVILVKWRVVSSTLVWGT